MRDVGGEGDGRGGGGVVEGFGFGMVDWLGFAGVEEGEVGWCEDAGEAVFA